MRGRHLALTPSRRLVCDLMWLSLGIPRVTVQRRMNLAALREARKRTGANGGVPLVDGAVNLSLCPAGAGVSGNCAAPFLRWPMAASVRISRQHRLHRLRTRAGRGAGRACWGRHPRRRRMRSLAEIDAMIRHYRETPAADIPPRIRPRPARCAPPRLPPPHDEGGARLSIGPPSRELFRHLPVFGLFRVWGPNRSTRSRLSRRS